MPSLRLFGSLCLVILLCTGCADEEDTTSILEGTWRLLEVEATGVRIGSQRGSVGTWSAKWRAENQNFRLSFDGFTLTTSGDYTFQFTGSADGRRDTLSQDLIPNRTPQDFMLSNQALTLEVPIFDFNYGSLDMDSEIVPVEIRVNVSGDELTLSRNQGASTSTLGGLSLSQNISATSVWLRE